MPTVRRTRPWTRKPPLGTRLGNTQFSGPLPFFLPLNEGSGGGAVTDAANGLTLAGVLTPTWTSGPAGIGLNCSSNGQGAIATLPPYLQLVVPITLAVGFQYIVNPVSTGPLIGFNASSGTTGTRIISLEQAATTKVELVYNGTNIALGSTTNLALGSDHTAIASITAAGAGTMYVDGVSVATASGISTGAYSSPSVLLGNSGSFYSGRTCGALIYWAAIWNSALNANDAAILGSSVNAIWQLFQPARGNFLFPSVGAPPSTLVRRTLYSRAGSRGVA